MGSSRNSTRGECSRPRAISSRRRMPPEKVATLLRPPVPQAHHVQDLAQPRTRYSSRDTPYRAGVQAQVVLRAQVGVERGVLEDQADVAPDGRAFAGRRRSRRRGAVPAVGVSSVHSMLIVVDLPAPFGPRKPKISPRRTSRSMPRTARDLAEVLGQARARSPRYRPCSPRCDDRCCSNSTNYHVSGAMFHRVGRANPRYGEGMPTPLDPTFDPHRARRSCSTTTSTAASGRRRSRAQPSRSATSALPATDADELAGWFRDAADSGSLERYLETFAHTVAVMQTAEGLRRVARECVEDLAADGVVYAEVRWAPEQHVEGGLTLEEVVEAVLAGFARGREAGRRRPGRRSGSRRSSPRCGTPPAPPEIAQLAVRYRDDGRRRLRHRRRRGRASRPPGTWTRSSTCAARTSTSPSTPARRSGCPRSGRRSSGAAPTGSATGCASSTTSPRAASSAGSPSTCGTSGSRWRCARRRTCRPGRRPRSPNTRSACCAACSSGSPSTPTTG